MDKPTIGSVVFGPHSKRAERFLRIIEAKIDFLKEEAKKQEDFRKKTMELEVKVATCVSVLKEARRNVCEAHGFPEHVGRQIDAAIASVEGES